MSSTQTPFTRILVVEDEQLIANDLKETLECLGYDVPLPVSSGEGAIAQVALLRPDLILMDIRLDGEVDGVEASAQIQSLFNIPVIFLTANADRPTLERVKASHPFGYLLKPYDENLLSTTIEIALTRHRIETQARQALDRAESKQAAAELYSQQKSSYLAMTAHEFRNPLTAIQFATEMLQDRGETLSHQNRQKHFQRIQTATNNLNEILDRMLVLEQAELGQLACERAAMDVVSFCRDQIEALQLTLGSHYTLRFTTSAEQAVVELDAKLFIQLLNNLLSNAVKYSPEGGTIALTLTFQPQWVDLQVQDTGIGIPAEQQALVFQPFYRGHNVNSISGTGLGLAIAKQCVELHQGQICLESTLGKGTTVYVSLPR